MGKQTASPSQRTGLLMKQPNMNRVLVALGPLAAAGVYFFGWRAAGVLAACTAVGFGAEWLMARRAGIRVSTACFVTCWLYALSLPPTVPLGVAAVGVVVAIVFGKMVFGGFGRHFANPAIVGRAFVYLCFPDDLTNAFVPAFRGFPGGLGHWSFASLHHLPEHFAAAGGQVVDAVGQASPMWVAREYGFDAVGQATSWLNVFLGGIGGVFQAPGEQGARVLAAGSIGEGCGPLILLGAAYLLLTRTANWRLMAGGFAGLAAANALFRNVLGFSGLGQVPPLAWQLAAGSTLYVLVFMVTDPVSAPKKRPAQLAYGVLIGFLMVLLRWRGVFVAAASFTVLLGNMVGPLLDLGSEAWEQRRKGSPAPAAERAAQ